MYNVRVEYDPTPIRHIAVQCPECNQWFHGRDITKRNLNHDHDIPFAEFECPVCGKDFGGLQHRDEPNVQETSYPDVYEGCLEKKEVWQ